TVNGDNSITYTPATGFNGTDTFTYTVTDSEGATSSATVTVTVDTPPVAANDRATTRLDTTTTINVLTNDTVEDDVSSVSADSGSNDATSAVDGNNRTLEPPANAS